MAVNPRQWIYGFLDGLPSLLAKPLRFVADRIFSILDDGVTFARWIKSGVAYWYDRAISFAASLVVFGAELVTTAIWIVTTLIPQRVAAAIDALKRWATPLINGALNTAKSLIATLRRWAETAINVVASALAKARDFLVGKINEIIDKLKKTVDVWFDRLTHPEKMAAWLAAALVKPLWNYVYGQRAKYAQAFLRLAIALTLRAAREIDALIARFL